MKSKFNGFISFLWTSLVSIYRGDLIHLTGLFNLYALITVLFCFFFQKKLIISAEVVYRHYMNMMKSAIKK